MKIISSEIVLLTGERLLSWQSSFTCLMSIQTCSFSASIYIKKEIFRLGCGHKTPKKAIQGITLSPLRSKNAEVAVKLRWSKENFPFALILDIQTLCLVFLDKLCSVSSCFINCVSTVLHRNFIIPNVLFILSPSNLWLPTFKLGSQASHPLLEQILCNPKNSINLS